MARFYASIKGSRGEVSRLGGKSSGATAVAAGWGGAIKVELSVREWEGKEVDWYTVWMTPWKGSGGSSVKLTEGVLDAVERDIYCKGGMPTC